MIALDKIDLNTIENSQFQESYNHNVDGNIEILLQDQKIKENKNQQLGIKLEKENNDRKELLVIDSDKLFLLYIRKLNMYYIKSKFCYLFKFKI